MYPVEVIEIIQRFSQIKDQQMVSGVSHLLKFKILLLFFRPSRTYLITKRLFRFRAVLRTISRFTCSKMAFLFLVLFKQLFFLLTYAETKAIYWLKAFFTPRVSKKKEPLERNC